MSWVELHSSLVGRSAAGDHDLLRGFDREVGQPALRLLEAVASAAGTQHGDVVNVLSVYAPAHILPHLGLPFTRTALGTLGVCVLGGQAEFPSPVIRADCWTVGVW